MTIMGGTNGKSGINFYWGEKKERKRAKKTQETTWQE